MKNNIAECTSNICPCYDLDVKLIVIVRDLTAWDLSGSIHEQIHDRVGRTLWEATTSIGDTVNYETSTCT